MVKMNIMLFTTFVMLLSACNTDSGNVGTNQTPTKEEMILEQQQMLDELGIPHKGNNPDNLVIPDYPDEIGIITDEIKRNSLYSAIFSDISNNTVIRYYDKENNTIHKSPFKGLDIYVPEFTGEYPLISSYRGSVQLIHNDTDFKTFSFDSGVTAVYSYEDTLIGVINGGVVQSEDGTNEYLTVLVQQTMDGDKIFELDMDIYPQNLVAHDNMLYLIGAKAHADIAEWKPVVAVFDLSTQEMVSIIEFDEDVHTLDKGFLSNESLYIPVKDVYGEYITKIYQLNINTLEIEAEMIPKLDLSEILCSENQFFGISKEDNSVYTLTSDFQNAELLFETIPDKLPINFFIFDGCLTLMLQKLPIEKSDTGISWGTAYFYDIESKELLDFSIENDLNEIDTGSVCIFPYPENLFPKNQ